MYGIYDSKLYYKQIYTSSNQSLTSNVTSVAKQTMPNVGHIASFVIRADLTITAGTGVINTAVTVWDAINMLNITDVHGKSIILIPGTYLTRTAFVSSTADSRDYTALRRGRFTAAPNLANTGATQTAIMELQCNVRPEDTPIGIEFALNSLSSVLSTVGNATATLNLTILTKSYKTSTMPFPTDRLYTFNTITLTAGTKNVLTSNLPKNVLIQAIGLQNINNVDGQVNYFYSTDNLIGLDRYPEYAIIQHENDNYLSGHVTGMYILPTTPFTLTDTLEFAIEPNTATQFVAYIMHNGTRQ